MKIKLLILAIICSLALAGPALSDPKRNSKSSTRSGSSSSSSSSKGPRLAIKSTVHDIMDVNAGAPVIHDFTLTNTGGAALQILQVAAACGCTVASYDQSIAPGQSGKVSLRVDIAPEWTGRRVNQSAIVETNDPRNQYVTLTIVAHVKPAPGQEPAEPERKGKKTGEGERTSLSKSKSEGNPETVEPETGEPASAEAVPDKPREELKEPAPVTTAAPETTEMLLPAEDEPAPESPRSKPVDRRSDGRAKTTLAKPESSEEAATEAGEADVQEVQPEPTPAPVPQPAATPAPQAAPEPAPVVEPQAAPAPSTPEPAVSEAPAEPADNANEAESTEETANRPTKTTLSRSER